MRKRVWVLLVAGKVLVGFRSPGSANFSSRLLQRFAQPVARLASLVESDSSVRGDDPFAEVLVGFPPRVQTRATLAAVARALARDVEGGAERVQPGRGPSEARQCGCSAAFLVRDCPRVQTSAALSCYGRGLPCQFPCRSRTGVHTSRARKFCRSVRSPASAGETGVWTPQNPRNQPAVRFSGRAKRQSSSVPSEKRGNSRLLFA